jgi:hypothetical protein
MAKVNVTLNDIPDDDAGPLTEKDLWQTQQIYGEILRRLKKRRHGFSRQTIRELRDIPQESRKALLEDNADGHLPEELVEKDLRLWDEIEAVLATIPR